MAAQATALAAIEAKYGVPKEILVSIWGNETDFGGALGSFNIFEALATLAYDGPRSDFGRTQLLAALRMMQQERLDPSQMVSSWAGAFGQLQMLPTTFLKSAVDGDGDGKRDLWHSAPDALASAAVEVSSDGWQRGHIWGYEVKLPANFAYELADGDTAKSVADWSALGVTTMTRGAARQRRGRRDLSARRGARTGLPDLRKLQGDPEIQQRRVLCAGGVLSRRSHRRPFRHRRGLPRDEAPLSHDERVALQNALTKLGYSVARSTASSAMRARRSCGFGRRRTAFPPTVRDHGVLAQVLIEAKQKGL